MGAGPIYPSIQQGYWLGLINGIGVEVAEQPPFHLIHSPSFFRAPDPQLDSFGRASVSAAAHICSSYTITTCRRYHEHMNGIVALLPIHVAGVVASQRNYRDLPDQIHFS